MIPDALKSCGLTISIPVSPLEQGNLNNVCFVQDTEGRDLVLRQVKISERKRITTYLGNLYDRMGLSAYGGSLHLRTVQEQVQTLNTLARAGINVPQLVDSGPDWMLISRMDGEPLKDVLESCTDDDIRIPIDTFLSALMNVHAKGVCLWDRWGANELVNASSQIAFIDFDIAVIWPEDVPFRTRAAFDLAIPLRSCIQYAPNKQMAGSLVLSNIYGNPGFKDMYDAEALISFLEGQYVFYDNLYCQQQTQEIARKTLHDETNSQIIRLCSAIKSTFLEQQESRKPRLEGGPAPYIYPSPA